jgi:hypothetical protein
VNKISQQFVGERRFVAHYCFDLRKIQWIFLNCLQQAHGVAPGAGNLPPPEDLRFQEKITLKTSEPQRTSAPVLLPGIDAACNQRGLDVWRDI